MRRLLIAAANASFLLSQVIAACGWVVDIITRLLADSLAGLSNYLREKADP